MKNRHRRLSCFLMALALLLAQLPAAAEEAEPAYTVFTPEKGEHARSILADGEGGGWLLTGLALYAFRPEGEGYAIEPLAANEKELIALGLWAGDVYALSRGHEILRLAGEGFELISGEAPNREPMGSAAFAPAGDMFYWAFEEDGRKMLAGFDPASGAYAFEEDVFSSAWCAYDPQGGQLWGLVYDEGQEHWHLAVLDEATGRAEPQQMLLGYTQRDHISHAPAEAAFYLSGAMGLVRRDMEGSSQYIHGIPDMALRASLGGGRFAGIWEGGLMVYRALKQAAGTITTFGKRMNQSRDFTRQTGIVVNELAPGGVNGLDEVAVAMVTQDDSVDLFAFLFYNSLMTIKDKGFYVDLSSSDILKEALGNMYPAIARAMVNDSGEIVAWPVSIEIHLRAHDFVDVFEEQGLPVPDTWDDALDLIALLEEQDFFIENDYVPFALWNYTREEVLAYLVQEYLLGLYTAGERMSFDSPVFRHLAQRVMNEVPVDNPYPREDVTDVLFQASGVGGGTNLPTRLFAPLKVDPEAPAKISAEFRVFVLNPYSKNRDEAIRFLEFLAQESAETDYALFQNLTDPVKDEYYYQEWEAAEAELERARAMEAGEDERLSHENYLRELEARVGHLYEFRYKVSREGILNYQQFAQQFVVLEDSLIRYNDKFGELIRRIVQGGIDLEQFIKEADGYIRLVLAERGR